MNRPGEYANLTKRAIIKICHISEQRALVKANKPRCTLANNRGPIMAFERNASNQVYSVLHYVIDMCVKCGKPLQKDGPFTSPPTR